MVASDIQYSIKISGKFWNKTYSLLEEKNALIGYSKTGYSVLFTDSPSAPLCDYKLPYIMSIMASVFAVVTNNEISQIIKQTVAEIHKEGDKIWFESFNR